MTTNDGTPTFATIGPLGGADRADDRDRDRDGDAARYRRDEREWKVVVGCRPGSWSSATATAASPLR